MILVIDNYDSFTYNLVQMLELLHPKVNVFRNNKISLSDIEALTPSFLIISPGPGRPSDAGITVKAIQRFGNQIPVLGVCLGHQSIAEAFGGRIISAKQIMHGKVSQIVHNSRHLFAGMPSPFEAVRYHSLAIEKNTLPDCLEVTAWTEDGEIMGIKHREYPIEGVQFHPESILTKAGGKLLQNFLEN